MADAFDLVHNPKTGQNYIRLPGSDDYQQISPEQAQVAQEGGLEAFMNAAGNSLGQVATGAGAIMGSETSRDAYDQLVESQMVRQGVNPWAGYTGAFAPDVALGLATGGTGTVAKRVGTTAVLEGALNAARSPDNPGTAFAIGATIGGVSAGVGPGVMRGLNMAKAAKVGANINLESMGRFGEFAQPAVDAVRRIPRTVGLSDVDAGRSGALRSLSAAARGADATPYQASDTLMGLDFEGAAQRGLRLTQGDVTEGMARNTDDAATGARLRTDEELARSNPASVMGRTVNSIRDQQEEWLTQRVATEMGNPNLERLTIPNVNKERVRIGNTFDRVLKRGDESMEIRLNQQDIQAIQDAVADVPTIAETGSFRRIAEDIDKILERGMVSGKELNTVRNTLNETRDRLIAKGSTYDAGLALDQIESVFNRRLRELMSPDDLAEFDEALKQWKMVKAVEGSMRAADAGGKVNPRTFRNTYLRQNPLVRKGYVAGDFENDLMVVDFTQDKAGIGNSGTADRLIPYMMGAGGLGLGGGLLGGN